MTEACRDTIDAAARRLLQPDVVSTTRLPELREEIVSGERLVDRERSKGDSALREARGNDRAAEP